MTNRPLAAIALAVALFAGCAGSPPAKHVPASPVGVTEVDGVRRYGHGELRYVGGVPYVTLRGGRFEMGEQYGALLATELAAAFDEALGIVPDIEAYLPPILRFLVQPVLVRGTIRDMANRIPVEYLEELRGIAAGSGIPYDELLFAAGGMGTFEFGCTSIAVRRGSTPLLGRNLDWAPGWLGRMPVVIRFEPDGEQASLVASMLAFPNVALTGLNASGLSLSVDIVSYDRKKSNRPVPVYFELRRALEQDRAMADLEARFADYLTDIGWLVTAVSAAERETAIFELATDGVAVRRGAPDSYLYALNGFADPAVKARHTPATIPTNVDLDDRVQYQERYAAEDIVPGVDDMIRYLSDDEFNGYEGYVGFESRSHSGTIMTAVMDGAAGQLYLASEAGFAGWAAFNRFGLDGDAAPYRAARPIMDDPAFRKILDINSYYFQDMYGGRAAELYARLDLDDGIEAIEAQLLFQLAMGFPVDPAKAVRALEACRERYPDYGSFPLMLARLALAANDGKVARERALEALESRILYLEQELAALEILADLASTPAERTDRIKYAERCLVILDRLGKTAVFTGPAKDLKEKMEKYARK